MAEVTVPVKVVVSSESSEELKAIIRAEVRKVLDEELLTLLRYSERISKYNPVQEAK